MRRGPARIPGHPGLHAYAAALAATEADGRSLRVFLRALAVGWEVGARLGLLLGAPRPGVHPHGGWGTGAAAAAAGIVTGQDTAGVTDTVNLALTVALAGPEADTRRGHAAHYLLPALGTANGLTVARLADAGFPATGPALPHLARTVHHGGTDRPVDGALGSRPLLPDAYFKPVGVCAHTLTGWTVARAMARDLTADEVATVTVDTYAGAALLAERRPVGRLARQFSIPWVVACGLVGTDPGAPDGPADDRRARAARLAERVTVRHDPGLDQGYPAGRPAVVEVTTRSGARLTGRARFHHGDREDPMTADELAAVDAALLRTPGVPAGAAELLHGLTRAPGATRLRDLTALVRGGAPNPNGGPPSVPAGPGPSGRKDMTSW
ncbi:MmgE/PrpD family protein [Micromonospora sp. CA-248260]|uniref:MmgE/PrpD family protein n=1 Tax=Micromonospora sp. CA-248260 TaxID=3239962 RepID=UPI003D941600